MNKVLISGGTGLVGSRLSMLLAEKGYEVALLSRSKQQNPAFRTFLWNPEKGSMDHEALSWADFIIHLAGANIAEKRWTKKQQQLLRDSRVKSGELLVKEIEAKRLKPKAFISASAIGYYGTLTSEKIFKENDPPAKDFLGRLCEQWEQTAHPLEETGIRTVYLRTGIVLTKTGGALEKMKTPAKYGMASALGTGHQYLPWIHVDDLCGLYLKALEDASMKGPYNAVAPSHVSNSEFTSALCKVMKKPNFLPNVPAFVLRVLFGKMADVLLYGSRVSADKLMDTGFHFKYPKLQNALHDLIHN